MVQTVENAIISYILKILWHTAPETHKFPKVTKKVIKKYRMVTKKCVLVYRNLNVIIQKADSNNAAAETSIFNYFEKEEKNGFSKSCSMEQQGSIG